MSASPSKPPTRSALIKKRLELCGEIADDHGCLMQEVLLADLIESLDEIHAALQSIDLEIANK